jgi:hypothetical protein
LTLYKANGVVSSKAFGAVLIALAIFSVNDTFASDELKGLKMLQITAAARQVTEHAWAGIYSVPLGLDGSIQISVTPEGKSAYMKTGNVGLKEFGIGKARYDEATESLYFNWESTSPGTMEISREMVVLHWKQETLLVPKGRMHQFCQLANSSVALVPRLYLIRKNLEDEVNLSGLPNIPREFAHLWGLRSIETKVVDFTIVKDNGEGGQENSSRFLVTLDAGSLACLYVGMELVHSSIADQLFRVTDVSPRSATAMAIDYSDSVNVNCGDVLTTKL